MAWWLLAYNVYMEQNLRDVLSQTDDKVMLPLPNRIGPS